MNRFLFSIPVLMILLVSACDEAPEEPMELYLPTNMTSTVVQAGNTMKIIADFHYQPESNLLDHITWSNHQTHYFEYNVSGQIKVVRQLKVKEKVQEELWFCYDGALVSEVILVTKNLDYAYLEPVDSTHTGRIVFDYEGKHIIGEVEYAIQKGNNREYPVREAVYEYDGEGNILSCHTIYPAGSGSDETTVMTYDKGKHPYSGLQYYFMGESYVNNQLSRSEGSLDYSYDITLNSGNYPEIIYEKLGASNTRIIRYSYLVR